MLTRAMTFLSLCAAVPVQGQSCGHSVAPILVGSEWEQYVRTLQVSGSISQQPWTIRDLGPRQWKDHAAVDTTLPWSAIKPGFARANCHGKLRTFLFAPHARLTYNSSFPVSYNEGAVWAGRGLTLAADFGAIAAAGPLTVILAPTVFSAQNVPFTMAPNGLSGDEKKRFADWRNPSTIDLPQRFGETRYSRADFGQSSVRLDALGIALGVSTANQFLGPAYDHPIILGNNAAGFPRLFVGSSKPVEISRFGSMHGRVFWGKLSESEFSPLAGSGYSRLGSGFAAVFQPAGIPGLEIGGTRFVHVLQRRFNLNSKELLRPFGAFFVNTAAEPDNQLVSVFARLVLPKDGAELYGEFGREDTNRDLREFLFFPDHDSAYLLGLRKIWRRDESLLSVRAEVLNSRTTHLALSSTQAPWYVHSPVLQGHTHRGQALGSVAAYGGGASVVVLEQYDPRGRWRVEWHRLQLAEMRDPAPDLFKADVAHIVGANVLRFGRRADIAVGLAGIYEMNRYFGDDAFALRTTLSARGASFRQDR